jgi:hypothetical protein
MIFESKYNKKKISMMIIMIIFVNKYNDLMMLHFISSIHKFKKYDISLNKKKK